MKRTHTANAVFFNLSERVFNGHSEKKKIKSLRKKIQWHLKMTVVEGGKVLETFSIHAMILTPQVMGQGGGH